MFTFSRSLIDFYVSVINRGQPTGICRFRFLRGGSAGTSKPTDDTTFALGGSEGNRQISQKTSLDSGSRTRFLAGSVQSGSKLGLVQFMNRFPVQLVQPAMPCQSIRGSCRVDEPHKLSRGSGAVRAVIVPSCFGILLGSFWAPFWVAFGFRRRPDAAVFAGVFAVVAAARGLEVFPYTSQK